MKSRLYVIGIHWLAGLAVLLLLLTGCDVAQPGSQANGLHIHNDSLSIDWSTHLCVAYLAADAGIAGLGPGHWNSPDGSRPVADEQTIVRQGYAIYRPLRFSSMRILRDQRPQPTTEFDTVGGQVGSDSYRGDDPQVTPGQRYLLLFVPGIDPVAQAWNEKVMIVSATFPIDAKGIVTLQYGSVEQGTAYPARTAPMSQLTQQLANCK